MLEQPASTHKLPGPPAPLLVAGLVAMALGPLVAALASGLEPVESWGEIAAALGMLSGALLLLQFISSGRFESLSGKIGIDRTMGFLRIAALFLLAASLLHPLAYVVPTLLTNPIAGLHRLGNMLVSGRLQTGVITAGLLIFLVLFAVWHRRLAIGYEKWRILHGPTAIRAAGLMLHHAMTVGSYSGESIVRVVWVGLALVALVSALVVYVLRPLRMSKGSWQVAEVRVAARNVAELTIRSNEDTTFDFRGGQFVWLTVAPHRPPFHDHPFSIASAPTELPRLRFIVQEVGECTAGFRSLTAGQAVALDGPHGSFVVPAEAKCVVLVAGGVGIAPILGMLEEAASRRDLRPFRLLYAARNTEALACTVRLAELRDSLNLAVSYHVDEDARRSDGIGRLTDSEIDDLIAGVEPQSTTAMICGPPAMMEKVSDRLLERGLSAGNIHYERFDYASGNGRLDKVRRWQALAILGVLAAVAIAFGIR